MVRIRSVEPLEGFTVDLGFTDGTSRIVDLEPYLDGPVFESLRENRDLFCAVTVDPDWGTIVWPNGLDLDPDVLYYGLRPGDPMPADWRKGIK